MNNSLILQEQDYNTTVMDIEILDKISIIKIIVDFYTDKIGSIVREVTSNAIDSTIESGNNKPVIVGIYKKDDFGNYTFKVQDFGTGIDQYKIDTIIKKFGKSTKGDSKDLIGKYGIGCKSPFSYTNFFTWTGIKDGIESKWLFKRTDTEFSIDCLYTIDTDKDNGSTVEVDINSSYYDISNFSNSLSQQLAYFQNIYFVNEYEDINNNFNIYYNDIFRYSELSKSKELHITIGDVYYEINWKHLGIDKIYIPLALNFKLDEGLEPLPARESYNCNEKTKHIILNKIQELANYMVNIYNKNHTNYSTFFEYIEHIDKYKFNISISNINFNIYKLSQYSSISFNPYTVKGYNDKYVDLIYNSKIKLLYFYENVCYLDNKLKKSYSSLVNYNYDYLLCNNMLKGNKLKYIKHLYNKKTIIRQKHNICLFNRKEKQLSLYNILELYKFPKKEWRTIVNNAVKYIHEFINKCTIDVTNIDIPKDFLTSLRTKNSNKNITKIKDDGFIFMKVYNYGMNYIQTNVNIEDLKNKMILYSHDIKDSKKLSIFHTFFKSNKNPNITAVLSKSNLTTNLNFKHIDEFMKSKTFKKFITLYRIHKVLTDNDIIKMFSNMNTVISIGRKSIILDIDILKQYYSKYDKYYYGTITEGKMIDELLKYAEDNNIYDEEIEDNLKRVEKICLDLNFVQHMTFYNDRNYSNTNQNNIKEVSNIINKILLFDKLYKDKYDNFTLTKIEQDSVTN